MGQARSADTSRPGGPVTRREVLSRAAFWVTTGVHYLSEDAGNPAAAPDPHGRLYRTDCSGYVCMAWHADVQPATSQFDRLGEQISRDELLPGDALLWPGAGGYGPGGGHVLLFRGWAGPDRTAYVGLELAGGRFARYREMPYPYTGNDPRYVPWRYRNITADG